MYNIEEMIAWHKQLRKTIIVLCITLGLTAMGEKLPCRWYDFEFDECVRGYAYYKCRDCPEYEPRPEVVKR